MASKVKGYRRTGSAIKALSRVIDKPAGTASRFALQPIKKQAKANLISNGSVIYGDLLDGMTIRKVKKSPPSTVQHHVTASGKGVKTAHLVEFGTEPHWQPKLGRMHPGAQPYPFLTPAFEQNEQNAVNRYNKKFGPAMEAQAARLNKGRR